MSFHRTVFRQPIQPLYLLSICMMALIVVGCGDGDAGVPVTGKVTFQGQPLADASITFFPDRGRPLTASLDSQGAYSLRLAPGNYKVTVGVGTVFPAGWKEGDPPPPPRVKLPPNYTVLARTKLSATVAESQSEPINFNL